MNNNKHNKHNIQYDMQTDDLINKYTQSNIKINNYTPFILLFFVIIINAYFNSKFQLHFDEAYYWVWGKNLALSYYDHPPMIAYLAKISTYFGLSEFYVRLPNLFCITIALIYIYKLAKDCFNIQVANLALLFAITCPIYEALFFIFTPDSPLLLFWVLTIYYFYKAIFENNTVSFYLAGIYGGLALLSKYNAILLFISFILFLSIKKKYHYVFRNYHLYLAVFLSLIVFSPVIIWNYEHNFASFIFQYKHGVTSGLNFNMAFFLEYLGVQILTASPVVYVVAFYCVIKYFNDIIDNDKLYYLLMPSITVFIFFGILSLFKHMEGNWYLTIYSNLFIILSYYICYIDKKILYNITYYSALLLIIIALVLSKNPTHFIPKMYQGKVPAFDTFFGNKEMLSYVDKIIKTNNNEPDKEALVFSCDYSNASKIWFYLQLKQVYVLSEFPFANTYRYWNTALFNNKNKLLNNNTAFYVCDNTSKENLAILNKYFNQVTLLNNIKFTNNITKRYMFVYKLDNKK